MIIKKILFPILSILVFSGTAEAGAPQLGDWQLLFKNDDGRAVALDVYRETPVILDAKGEIYFLNTEIGMESKGSWFGEVYENWQKVSGGGTAIDISVDGNGVPWVVSKRGRKIYYLDGDFRGTNRGWIEHPGNGRASRISVAKASGVPYMVGATTGRVFKGTDNGWEALPTKLLDSTGRAMGSTLQAKDLYAKSYDVGNPDSPDWRELVFVINGDNRVYLYSAEDGVWRQLPGDIQARAVITSGQLVYIIGTDGHYYGTSLPDGTGWDKVAKGKGRDLAYSQVSTFQPFVSQGGKHVQSSSHRYIWSIGEKGQVYRAFVAY